MSKINVVFAVNDGYVNHLLIAIYSLLKNNKQHLINIYVLQKDFTNKSKQKTSVIESYFNNVKITVMDMNDQMHLFEGISLVIDYISIETYFRFVLPNLFPEHKKILYLDADILVTGDISELWETDIKDYFAAGVEDPHILTTEYKRDIDFNESDLYVNAGVLLFNLDNMRNSNIVSKLFDGVRKEPNIKYQDQDILNIVLRNNIKGVDKTNNFVWIYQQNYREQYEDVKIVHFTGPVKPWDNYGLNDRPYWFYMYDEAVDDFTRMIENLKDTRSDQYGLLTYKTENIGDDIQSIAARQYLPRIDYFIERDNIDGLNFKDAKSVKLIMNGWYTHKPENWPPKSKKINPLLVAMYFSGEYNPRVKKAVLSEESRNFFHTNTKVGARDYNTLEFLENNGIDSYFSGCLTLTIKKSEKIKKQDFILAVDVPDSVLEVMKKQTKKRIISLSPELLSGDMSSSERLTVAEGFLALIQSAQCVVTTRLHTAMPSLALETPVLFIIKKNHQETDRLRGLVELTYNLDESEYISNPKKYDINCPVKNLDKYKELRQKLILHCSDFTGFKNKGGYLSGELPFDIKDLDFVRMFYNSLYCAYRYQNLNGILTETSEYASTEIEKYAQHLKALDREYVKIDKENKELKEANEKYREIINAPGAIRKKLKNVKGIIKGRK